MSDEPLQNEVLSEIGDDRLQEIAGLLGTDPESARKLVGTSVTSLTGVLTDDAVTPGGTAELSQALEQAATEPEPPAGAAGFAGLGVLGSAAGGGMLLTVLRKVTAPTARAVSKKTGLPVAAVAGALELVIPVVATVLAKRARSAK
ncbi:DUF937 domain-containing protein [Streptomyces sp. H10-C2]|uniref:DUF937 domain-containing protein n=1 Tax=unclassified Streptomyces TaxID=2593676 RepID=UPI0024B90C34|nr:MULTISPECIES: DUF937 domain-containing protein [unclassified Streptomyces]MDJ0340052.1 DUF937 domain-containing protein [Streptomyces sp. PH10-H1]MDJ0369311.1 DUF937 domain-containing protein [Streptomyces sp. H10-C2]